MFKQRVRLGKRAVRDALVADEDVKHDVPEGDEDVCRYVYL